MDTHPQFSILLWCKQDGCVIEAAGAVDDTNLLEYCNLLIQFRQVLRDNGVWAPGHGPGAFFLCNIQIPVTVGCQAWYGACLEDSSS